MDAVYARVNEEQGLVLECDVWNEESARAANAELTDGTRWIPYTEVL